MSTGKDKMQGVKRFISIYIPVTTCTLRCHYCYITHHRIFDGPLPKFKYSAEQVRKALSIKRLGGVCLINVCGGGETLLPPMVLEYVKALLEEGHYVMIVTNATVSKRFEEIATFPKELTNRLFFKFSYHYLQFKERNLFDTFFSNIKKVRDAGCSFTLEITPSDELIPFIDDACELAIKELGATPHITVARDERQPDKLPILSDLSRADYKKIWSVFNSSLFDYKMSIFEVKRKEFCYAGDWSFLVNAVTGMMTQCYGGRNLGNIFDNPDKPIPFCAVGNMCSQHHCYNGHAFLVIGDIPELKDGLPTYADLRNRITADGDEWLKPDMKNFMSTRLWDNNKEYSENRKRNVNLKNRFLNIDYKRPLRPLVRFFKKFKKGK